MTQSTSTTDLITVITDGHRDVAAASGELEPEQGSPQHRPELADHGITEHTGSERILKRLEGLSPTEPPFDDTLGELIPTIRAHISAEEGDMLPRPQAACDPEELSRLGTLVLRAEDAAPTRPHPPVPEKSPANLLLDSGAALVDQIRDARTGRSHYHPPISRRRRAGN